MRIQDAVRKNGIGVAPTCTVQEAAQLMERDAVGALAVVENDVAIGMVTDRDLVCRAVARGIGADARVDSVMSTPVVSLPADADLRAALEVFQEHAIRRIVIERDGSFVGVLAADDLLVDLAADLSAVVRPIAAEVLFGHHDNAAPATV